jgi:hypothetical protein
MCFIMTPRAVLVHNVFFARDLLKSKAKAVPLHAMKALGGEEYSCYSFSTSALDGVSGQRHAPETV